MSFSSDCKNQLVKLKVRSPMGIHAALSGLFSTAGSLELGGQPGLSFVTDNGAVARWAQGLLEGLSAGLDSRIAMHERNRLGRSRRFSLCVSGEMLPQLLQTWGILQTQGDYLDLPGEVPARWASQEEWARLYLRGAFLGVGTLSNPDKAYQLEFVLQNETMAASLQHFLQRYDLRAKWVRRKAHCVVYLKESDNIAKLLGLLGASGAVLRFEETRVLKELRNQLNRQVNFETANLDKTAGAAVRQIENIRWLLACGGWEPLSLELQQMATVRLQHPDATLAELGELLSPPISKSGVNHRLRKLNELAETCRGQKEG